MAIAILPETQSPLKRDTNARDLGCSATRNTVLNLFSALRTVTYVSYRIVSQRDGEQLYYDVVRVKEAFALFSFEYLNNRYY